jgi:hypothetical protein
MSLRGILEIVIHVESFRNVDLSHQGLYMLRLHIYNQNEDKVNSQTPNSPFINNLYLYKFRNFLHIRMELHNQKVLIRDKRNSNLLTIII